ncbi:MAG: ABC transporter permease [Longimicrobiales bacterium]
MPTPPPIFTLLIGLVTERRFRAEIRGSLREEFEDRIILSGERDARRWYRGQVVRSVGPLLWWRLTRREAAWRNGARRVGWSAPGQDARYAVRSLLGTPGFSLVVILTFALGIGVNTAVFSLLHSLVLEPLPFPGGDRMVQLWRYEEFEDGRRSLMPPARPMVAAWQGEEGLFEEMGGYAEQEFHLSVDEGVESIPGARVSPGILSMVSVTPVRGRLLGPGDAIPGRGNVLLLSEDTWVRRFGSDPGVIGRTLLIDGAPHTVVGVTPRSLRGSLESGFFGIASKEILLPLGSDPEGGWSGNPNIVGRLQPGLTVQAAQERQPRVAPLIEGQSQWLPLAVAAREVLSFGFRRGLWVVFAAVGAVLLIACANIAILLLVRRLARAEEMKVRLALGAGRARLVGQLFTESLLLGLAGMVLAVLTAGWLVEGAVGIAGGALPEIRAARLDPDALGFAVAAGLVTILAFSLIPIHHLRGLRPAGALTRERPRETRRPMGWAAYKSLVVGQVALAMPLVLSAGLLSNSLGHLLSVDPGIPTEGLAAVSVDLPRARYDVGVERIAFFDEVVRGLENAPGVEAAGWAKYVPPRVAGAPGTIDVEGRARSPDDGYEAHAGNWVSPSYFRAVGAPFLSGRPFNTAEIADRESVVILNRSGAERLWPHGDGGVGSRIRLDSDFGPSPWMTVVGIVPDFKAWWLGDRPDRMQVYLPASDVPPRSAVILVRGGDDLGSVAALVQRQVRRLDPGLPVGESYWVADAFRQSVARQRFQAFLLSSFGVMGMLLAVLGVYGILSLSVARRTREIGVRLALGAEPGDVSRKVLGQGLKAVVTGTALGLGLFWFTADLLADLLWGVEATDPATWIACAGGVVLAGLAATYGSTRRATRIDPVDALKRE